MTTFQGSNDNDNIVSDADVIYARKGDDVVRATKAGSATVYGGEGDDILSYEGFPRGQAALFGGDGADWLRGNSGDDSLIGGLGQDTLSGAAGNDLLEGGRGGDLLDGGPDIFGFGARDTATYVNAAGPVRADLLAPVLNSGEAAGDSYISIENLIGSAFADTLSGNNFGNVLEGGGGGDRLVGLGNTDYASYEGAPAGVHADLLQPAHNTGDAAGDAYSDIEFLLGSAFGDVLGGDEATNLVLAGGGDDTILGRGGDDDLRGGAGADRLDGGADRDLLLSGEGHDTLAGGDGHDFLFGEAGDDLLIGGDGDDTFAGGEGSDRHDGGAGVDTADYSIPLVAGLRPGVRADLSNPATNAGEATGDTYSSIENLQGTDSGDILKGDNSANTLTGLGGNDLLIGLGGSDVLVGAHGDDTLQGQGGHDLLDGGSGKDVLSGGASGWDIFAFDMYPEFEEGPDFQAVITDFEDGVDLLRLRELRDDEDGGWEYEAVGFAGVVITQVGADVLIVPNGSPESWIRLLGQSAANFTSADFIAG
jgi:Ca2+-binding RTX toxin-like protein